MGLLLWGCCWVGLLRLRPHLSLLCHRWDAAALLCLLHTACATMYLALCPTHAASTASRTHHPKAHCRN